MLLRCEECSTVSEGQARGWLAMIVEDMDESSCVVTFCPTCGWREFPDEDGVSRAEA